MYARSIEQRLAGRDARFVTLTLRHCDEPLTEQLDHLYNSFRKLRTRKHWKNAVKASIGFTEITYNNSRKQFHLHLHIITIGSYLPQKQLSEMWRSASKGSHVVDIRAIPNKRNAIKYITKYASKGISGATLLECDKAIEVVKALEGRRLIIGSGEWSKLKPHKQVINEEEWEYVKPLGFIIEDASRGNAESMLILEALHFNVKEVLQCYQTSQLNSG